VRLAGAYIVRCDEVVRDARGQVVELRCTHDPASRGAERRAAGTLNWVHATRSRPAEVRLYDRLFTVEQPDAAGDFLAVLNPESLVVAAGARVEPALADAAPGDRFQFLRQGYFFVDPVDSRPGAPVFNRTITLKDTWASRAAAGEARKPRPKRETAAAASPERRSRAELRAERRAQHPALAARHARYVSELGLGDEQADLLADDAALTPYFEAALAVHPNALSVARWLLNELVGLAKDARVDALPLSGAAFGRFVALVDAGRLTPAAGKTLLASLVAEGGDPESRMKQLGLEKVDDTGVIDAAIARALEAQRAEVERYRAGEKKLFGVLLGAVMREAKGAADAAVVRKRLEERLR
jgi:glutaminyl-tRNA synthetase